MSSVILGTDTARAARGPSEVAQSRASLASCAGQKALAVFEALPAKAKEVLGPLSSPKSRLHSTPRCNDPLTRLVNAMSEGSEPVWSGPNVNFQGLPYGGARLCRSVTRGHFQGPVSPDFISVV